MAIPHKSAPYPNLARAIELPSPRADPATGPDAEPGARLRRRRRRA
jgi:hypothetical protein